MKKKSFVLIVLMVVSKSFYCQNVAISVAHQNYLISNYYNSVVVAAENVASSSLILKIDNGKVLSDNGHFTVIPENVCCVAISVYSKKDNDTVLIAKIPFYVKDITKYCVPRISGVIDGAIDKKRILVCQGISAQVDNLDFDLGFPITSFKCMILRGDDPIFVKSNIGKIFSQDIKKGFELCQAGDYIYFFDIYGKGPDSKLFELSSIRLKIK